MQPRYLILAVGITGDPFAFEARTEGNVARPHCLHVGQRWDSCARDAFVAARA